MDLLTPETACGMCCTPIPRQPGRGRPRSYCDADCAREARRLAQIDSRASSYAIDQLDEVIYVPSVDRWTATYEDAAAHVRDVHGPGVSLYEAGFVPDTWRTLSRDDVKGVYPGDEVGKTCPRVGPVIGATDRRHGWDRREAKII